MTKKGLILKIFILLLVLISLSLLVYFLYPKYSKKLTEEKPVAIVAGEKISNKEYQTELAKSKDLITSLNSKLNPEKYVLDYLINKKIVEIEAKRRNITVSQDEIEKELQKLIKGYSSQEEFEKRIKASGFTIDDLKEKVKTDLLKEKLAPFLLNFRDGRFIYVRYDTMGRETSKEPIDPKEIEKRAEEKIEEWSKEISQGTSFDEIERRIIQGKENTLYVGRDEFKQYNYEKFLADFNKPTADVVFSLKEREVSKPVKSPSGYFAIYIVDRIGKGPYKNWEDFFNDFRKKEVKVFKNVFNFPSLKKIFSLFKIEEVKAQYPPSPQTALQGCAQ
jgi:foldase protein PrsA